MTPYVNNKATTQDIKKYLKDNPGRLPDSANASKDKQQKQEPNLSVRTSANATRK